MKTVKLKFAVGHAERAAMLFHNLDLKVLLSWSEEGFMDATNIYVIVKLNSTNAAIHPDIQIEKIRENTFLRILT